MRYITLIFSIILFSGCVREINIKNPIETDPLLVVEGYINQRFPHLNYVVLSESVNAFDTLTSPLYVRDAAVWVTEGVLSSGGEIIWDSTSTRKWVELSGVSWIPASAKGIYGDSLLAVNPALAMIGKENHFYKMEIQRAGKTYTGITEIPVVVPIDSVSYEIKENAVSGKRFGQITIHYFDPLQPGNNYFSAYDSTGYTLLDGWGAVLDKRVYDDHTINGVYRNEIRFTRFPIGDTVNYYVNSISRGTFNFWQSQINNTGMPNPFTSGAPIVSNLKGEKVTGYFSGFGVSHQRIIIQE